MKALSNQIGLSVISQPTGGWTREEFGVPHISAGPTRIGLPQATKHCRWVYCPLDQKFYLFGGDYNSEWQALQSGQHALMTFDPIAKQFDMPYPFWGKAGEVYPMHPDEAAICWDSRRKVFWFSHGYQGNANQQDAAQTIGTQIRGKVCAFDPVAKSWTQPFGPDAGMSSIGQYVRSVYDAEKDLIYGAFYHGGWGCAYAAFNPANNTTVGGGILGIPNNISPSGCTILFIRREVFFFEIATGRLCAFNVDFTGRNPTGRIVATVTPTPFRNDADIAYIESIDKILIWGPDPSWSSRLVDPTSGAITLGPPSPVDGAGAPYAAYHSNYHPPTGKVVIGWNVNLTNFNDISYLYTP